MAKFAIMRCSKIKTMSSAGGSLSHAFRERETKNADISKLEDNQHFYAESVLQAMAKIRENLPEKQRKDSVKCVEYLMTASPEWFETATFQEEQDFFQSSLEFLKEKYGEKNIIVASIHRDEKTPHMTAFVTPITEDGRLSAKEFIGDKKKMSEDQTKYAKKVEHLGLERGIQGSKAKHQTIQKYYEKVNQSFNGKHLITSEEIKPQKFKRGIMGKIGFNTSEETEFGIAKRLNAKLEPLAVKATEYTFEREKRQESQNNAVRMQKEATEAKSFLGVFTQGLKKEQIKELAERAKEVRQENEKQLAEQRKISNSQTKKAPTKQNNQGWSR